MCSAGFFVYGQHTCTAEIPVVVAVPVTSDLIMYRHSDVDMFKYVFTSIFKHTPHVISCAAAGLTTTFIESNVIGVGHYTIVAGNTSVDGMTGAVANAGLGFTPAVKCMKRMGLLPP